MLRFLPLIFVSLSSLGSLTACDSLMRQRSEQPPAEKSVSLANHSAVLDESWTAYRKRFIQADGRVIDWEATERSTSEGQAYALFRAVLANDPESFALALKWSENNLRRQTADKQPLDQLWAWQWGRTPASKWGILDENFASDADVDAITALILASRRWERPEYLSLARAKLKDLWTHSTVAVGSDRYLLPGPIAAFQKAGKLKFNPSYLALYAFRLFAQVDPDRDWLSLVNSSYQMLERSADVSSIGLPSDWVALDPKTGEYTALNDSPTTISRYGFDASRVWWRVALDWNWFQEPQAKRYLEKHLEPMKNLWRSQQKIPAQIDLQGNPLVDYDATSQYGMLYAAFRVVDPAIAQQIYEKKLMPRYQNGFWDSDSAYYTQNLAWFGLLPSTAIAPYLSPPNQAAQETHP
jgi:endoglucanase